MLLNVIIFIINISLDPNILYILGKTSNDNLNYLIKNKHIEVMLYSYYARIPESNVSVENVLMFMSEL